MTIAELIHSYQTDAASAYGTLRYATRGSYDSRLRIIAADLGAMQVADIHTRDIRLVYQKWLERGPTMAHGLIGQLRTVCGYGATLLEDDDCLKLAGKMRLMRFKMGAARSVRITAPQVVAIRRTAHAMGLHSLALAQTLQFGLMLRQKDVIGEWLPETEPGDSDLYHDGMMWLRGVRWDEIDHNLTLRHVTSKRLKEIEVDLTLEPMLMEELRAQWSVFPERGPVVVAEATGFPYKAHDFRALWRRVARAAGIPDEICSMDSRAGAISEATDAGASLELVRHAATHSDVATTARYSRGSTDKIAEVMRRRVAHRRSE